MLRKGRGTAVLAAVLTIPVASTGQTTLSWASPADGTFSDPSRWSPMAVPGFSDTALLGVPGSYLVRVERPEAIDTLRIFNPDATLGITSGQTLTLRVLEGAGRVLVNRDGGATGAELRARPAGLLLGTIELAAPPAAPTGAARLVKAGAGPDPILGFTGVLRGRGDIRTGLRSSGLIETTDPAGHLRLTSTSITIDQTPEARLRVLRGATLELNQATIRRGTIEVDAASTISPGTLDGVTIDGELAVRSGSSITLAGATEIDGQVVINREGAGFARLLLVPGASISGRVTLNAGAGRPPAGAAVSKSGSFGDDPTIAAGGILGGRGEINDDLNNEGVIEAIGPEALLEFSKSTGPQFIRQSATGVVRAVGGGRIVGNVTIEGGLVDVVGASFVDVAGLRDTRVTGLLDVRSGQDLDLAGVVTFVDALRINNDRGASGALVRVDRGGSAAGNVQLGADPSTPFTARVEAVGAGMAPNMAGGGTLSGSGQLIGGIRIVGELSPGIEPGEVGTVVAVGNLSLAASARTAIDIRGTGRGQFDRIIAPADGVTFPNGALSVRFAGGYEPSPRDRVLFWDDPAFSGTFSGVDLPDLPAFGPAHIVYASEGILFVACAADRDGDGELTLFDFLAFQNQFDAGDARADLDEDGQLTLFDFLAFQNRFDAGCP